MGHNLQRALSLKISLPVSSQSRQILDKSAVLLELVYADRNLERELAQGPPGESHLVAGASSARRPADAGDQADRSSGAGRRVVERSGDCEPGRDRRHRHQLRRAAPSRANTRRRRRRAAGRGADDGCDLRRRAGRVALRSQRPVRGLDVL
jgi:hypothetical protein